jgi:cytochrome c
MSDLGFNKIAGAVLATGLAVVGLHEVSGMTFEPEHAEKAGYAIAIPDAVGAVETGPELPPDWGTVIPIADVAAGQAQFAKCVSCHKPDDTNGTGPGMNGVMGRKPAGHAGFRYSDAMIAYGGANPAWGFDNVNNFITAPAKYMPGTKMTYAGLKKAEDRINLIAYLHTLNSNLPIPAPDPSRQPAPAAAAPAEDGAPAEGAAPAEGDAPAEPAPAAAAAP